LLIGRIGHISLHQDVLMLMPVSQVVGVLLFTVVVVAVLYDKRDYLVLVMVVVLFSVCLFSLLPCSAPMRRWLL